MVTKTKPEASVRDPRKYLVLLSIGVGTFMSALDGSVINISLPVIKDHFQTNIATIEWAVVIYLLVLSGALLTFGRLGDLRGHKSVYLIGFAIFVGSSAICGLSSSPTMLIVFRGIQALGAAMLSANSPAILTKNFPPTQRGQALGMQATMTYLGLVIGPTLGGWLTEQFTWRAVFYINIPVGLLAFLLSIIFIPSDKGTSRQPNERFDPAGALFFSGGLVMLLLGLNQGHAWGWGSPAILALVIGAVITLGVFILLEKRTPSPMLDLSLFRRRNFSTATISAVMNYITIYSIIFLLPFYLLQGRELSPSISGMLMTAQPLIMMIAAPLSGFLSDRVGTRLPSIFGLLILAGGTFMLSRIGATTPLAYVAAALAACGLGTGIFISPNSSALMGAAPRNRQGIASGVLATSRNLGMVLGVGLSGAVMTTLHQENSPQTLFVAIQVSFLFAMVPALIGSLSAFIRQDANIRSESSKQDSKIQDESQPVKQ